MYTREDLERAFDEGYEHGWARCAKGDRSDPNNPYTGGDDE